MTVDKEGGGGLTGVTSSSGDVMECDRYSPESVKR
jgi:hypothetical protein